MAAELGSNGRFRNTGDDWELDMIDFIETKLIPLSFFAAICFFIGNSL